MAWQTPVLLVLAFAAVALLAGSIVASAAVGLPAGAETMPSLHALRRVEDNASSFFVEGEEVASSQRRRVLYSSGCINYAALTASKAACYGPCPARGQAYSRGCKAIYQCRG